MAAPTRPSRPAPKRRPRPTPSAPPEAPRPVRRRPAAKKPPAPPTFKITRRRLIAMLVAACIAFTAVIARLAFVQVVASDRYTAFGESQRVRKIDLPAARGAIFDRNGRELALSVRQQTVWANPRLVNDPAAQAEALAPVLGIDAITLQDRLSRDAAFVYLARTVPDDVANQVRSLGLQGVFTMEEPKRFMPGGNLAAPLLGKVGVDNQGLAGVEVQFEKLLAGKPGHMVVEKDPGGGRIVGGIRERIPSLRGDDLVLTIDRSLQYETERALSQQIVTSSARGGIAVVMESSTGEILAMANLGAGGDGQPPQPAAKNTAITDVFEPGSVNKLITIAAALEEGIHKPADVLNVPGTIRVADHTFKEHDPHPPEDWTITDIMANSSNVGSIMIGQKLGKERIDKYLREFGFGSRTGVGFPGESRGLMLDTKDWSGTSIGTIPIGQGISVTALQMLAAYNTIANGGEYVAPKLVKATVDDKGNQKATKPSARRRVVSEKTATEVTSMLNEVVRVGTGTRAAIDGYTVAGKTGTARKPLEGARGYKAGAYVSSFAGFVPSERPALTAIVMLDEPTPIFGGLVAAPVFAEITRYGLRQFRIPPPPPTALPAAANVPAVAPEAAKGVGEAGASTPTTLAARPPAPSPTP